MQGILLNRLKLPVLKTALLFVTGLLSASAAFSQTMETIDSTNYVQPFSKASAFRTWSIGINFGVVAPFNDDYATANYSQPGVGIYVKKQFLSTLGVQLDINGGQVIGYNSRDNSISQYKTQYASAALSVNFTVANISWRNKQNVILPYVTAGYGYMGYQPAITLVGPGQLPSLYATGNGVLKNTFVPIGAGFKINVAKGVNVDLGYTVNLVNADDFDGLIFGTRNDEFSYAHVGVEIAIGNKHKPQLTTHNPVNSMRIEYLTMEQSLLLKIDEQKKQIAKLKADVDSKTALINTTNSSLIKLTTDSDGDGVSDLFDKCPGTPAGTVVDGAGCPLNGLRNATPPPPAKVIVQPVQTIVTEQDKKVAKEAVDNLQFDFGKATIRPTSYETLDNLASLLKERNISLKLAGYTDNMGPDAVNLRISRERAEAVRTYLISRGVNPSKIQANGYGKENPIASNDTLDGRILNRRVEFNLVDNL